MPRLTGNLRERAIGMLDAGLTAWNVARRMNVHETTISRLRTRYRDTGATLDRPRSGRPRVTTRNQDRYILLIHLRDRQLCVTNTARDTPGTHNPRVSGQTIRRRLYEANLRARRPYFGMVLTDERRHRRLDWAKARHN